MQDIQLFTSQPKAKFHDELPSYWTFDRFLRKLDNELLKNVMRQQVMKLAELGVIDASFIGLDSTPVMANTKLNNPKSFAKNKFSKENQPKNDPDCCLGVHTASNQINDKNFEFYWGYKNHVLVDCITGLPSLLHLNAMYDLCNRLYVDSCIQPRRCEKENKALEDMVDRSCIKNKVILVADRGYENYNIFAHIEKKGWNYVIRVKDSSSSGGILSSLHLPTDREFDITVQRVLTRKQTKEIKAHPEIYRFLPSNSTFDFLDLHTNEFYPISFRIVRFKIADDSYETVITNLNQSDFSPAELKELYKKRWGIETSFRELKYAVGLTHFHAKKVEYIAQEIYARMIMYNFSEMITSHVVIQHRDTQYVYQVNFTVAINICRYFFRNNVLSPYVEALIQKNILPIRPGRKDIRKIRYKTAVSFIYRVA